MVHDEDTGLETAVISLGAGVRKRVTLNTHAMQQKSQVGGVLPISVFMYVCVSMRFGTWACVCVSACISISHHELTMSVCVGGGCRSVRG